MQKEEQKQQLKYIWADIAPSDIVRVTYPTGHSAEFIQAGDMYFGVGMKKSGFCPDQRLNVHRVKRMKARDDDVLICAYPKAGTHWMWEITQMLIKGSTEYSKKGKESAMIEFHFPDEFDDWTSPRVLNSHFEFHNLPTDMINKKCKMIYIQRNPKDVAVSMYHFAKNTLGEEFSGSWNDFFHMFLNDVHHYMNWFKSTLSWERALENTDNNILPVYYEDLKKDPVGEITRLAKFLNVNRSDDFISEIADKCSFKKMKEGNKEARKEEMEKMAKHLYGKMSEGDAIEKITSMFYRKGDVGDWKNWFTVAQEEQFDVIYAEKMKGSKLQFKFVK